MSNWHTVDDVDLADAEIDAWDVEVTLSSGEIVTLPPIIARWRKAEKARQERARLAYCEKYGKDPATFTGCPSCGNTGRSYANGHPCYCPHSRSRLAFQKADEERETERLRQLVESDR